MKRKIINFITVSDRSQDDLDRKVNELLCKGYELYGNLIILGIQNRHLYQGMVKYDKPIDNKVISNILDEIDLKIIESRRRQAGNTTGLIEAKNIIIDKLVLNDPKYVR